MVEMTGFEPAASASRTQRSTKLSHISIFTFLSQEQLLKFYRRAATQLTLAVPEICISRYRSANFDRGAFSLSLFPPPTAVKLKATKLSHISIFTCGAHLCTSSCYYTMSKSICQLLFFFFVGRKMKFFKNCL